jgi:hypothetical protein
MNWKGRLISLLPESLRRFVLRSFKRFEPWQPEFDFRPPKRPPGEESGPPDFVGIGVRDCGTRWWHDLILLHPGVSQRDGLPKELHFFDRFGGEDFGPSMTEWYEGWFPRRPGTVAGEWTADYFEYPWVPELLQRAAPDVRLLLILRDPIERLRASTEWQYRAQHPFPARSVMEAVNPGFYNDVLERWLEVFDAAQLLILQYELCVADIEGQMKSTFDHLGLTEYHSSETERPRSPLPRVSGARCHLDHEAKERLVERYSPDVAALSRTLPHLDLSLWPNFAHLADGPTTADLPAKARSR